MRRDREFRDAIREAVEHVRAETGRAAADLFDEVDYTPSTPGTARALGVIEGAAIALGVTPIELLDEIDG